MSSRRLSQDDRVKMVVLREEGYRIEPIAARVKCSHSAVSKTLKKHSELGSVRDRPRTGRPRIHIFSKDTYLQQGKIENLCDQVSEIDGLRAHN